MAIQKREFMSLKGRMTNSKLYDIRIAHPDFGIPVIGKMKNNFSFQLSAKWADLFNGLIPGAELLMKTGNASLTTGIFSQKYFQGGNNLQLNSEFRVFDDGRYDFNPVERATKSLSNMTVSKPFSKEQIERDLKGAGGETLGFAGRLIANIGQGKGKEAVEVGYDVLNTWADRIMARAVNVKIGNFFNCSGMAIESVNVTYSKEMTRTGPLFGDFSVGLLSLRAIERGTGKFGVDTILSSPNFNITINGKIPEEGFNLSEVEK